MPQYAWNCLACGSLNSSGVERCALCACTALVTVTDIEKHRANHLAAGCWLLAARQATKRPDVTRSKQGGSCAAA